MRFIRVCQPCICYLPLINGSRGSKRLNGSLSSSFCNDWLQTLWLLSCLFPQDLRNIPYTKIRGFGMQISYYQIFEILVMNSFLSISHKSRNTPLGWDADHQYVPAPDIPRLLRYLRLSIGIIGEIFPFPASVFLLYFSANAILFWITHFTIRNCHMEWDFPFW